MNGHPALYLVPLFTTSSVVSSDFLPKIPAARKQPVNHQQGQNVQPSALMPAGPALSMMFKQNLFRLGCRVSRRCRHMLGSHDLSAANYFKTQFWKTQAAACIAGKLLYTLNLKGGKKKTLQHLRFKKHQARDLTPYYCETLAFAC